MVHMIFGGDICPTGKIQSAFREGDGQAIFHDLLEDIAGADLAVANLECPLIDRKTPIIKAGPVMGAPSDCIKGFKAAGWGVLNLANNHSYDHGKEGLRSTIRVIKEMGLGFVGAGMTDEEALAPYVADINGERVSLWAMAEREFSIADVDTPGANPLDIINFVRVIRQAKKGGAFIVLIHGGKEHYPYPTPEMVRRCRFMIDMGADAVIGTHAHCPLPWEIYAGKPIVYGMGNLVFENVRKRPDAWRQGYLARLSMSNGRMDFEAIPYHQSAGSLGAKRMDERTKSQFLHEMNARGARLRDDEFLRNQWAEYCRQHRETYLSGLFAHGRLFRKFRKGISPLLHSRASILRALLLVQCETHREVIETLFKDMRRGE